MIIEKIHLEELAFFKSEKEWLDEIRRRYNEIYECIKRLEQLQERVNRLDEAHVILVGELEGLRKNLNSSFTDFAKSDAGKGLIEWLVEKTGQAEETVLGKLNYLWINEDVGTADFSGSVKDAFVLAGEAVQELAEHLEAAAEQLAGRQVQVDAVVEKNVEIKVNRDEKSEVIGQMAEQRDRSAESGAAVNRGMREVSERYKVDTTEFMSTIDAERDEKIRADGRDPAIVKDIAEKISCEYDLENAEVRLERLKGRDKEIKARLKELKREMDQAAGEDGFGDDAAEQKKQAKEAEKAALEKELKELPETIKQHQEYKERLEARIAELRTSLGDKANLGQVEEHKEAEPKQDVGKGKKVDNP